MRVGERSSRFRAAIFHLNRAYEGLALRLPIAKLLCMIARRNAQPTDSVHPELGNREVFFTNASSEDYREMQFFTKRRGKVAYDGNGNSLRAEDWFPVFIRKEELLGFKITLNTLRARCRKGSIREI